jgi:acyl-CoA synthetase (AMP-forming)/AMP-acid ligase II
MKSGFLPGQMMDYPLTIDRLVEHANRLYPHKKITTKLADGSFHQYTYADLYKRVKRLGNVLHRLGIKAGDRVGTFSWNNYQHLELYFGIPGCAAVCHTLNIRLSAEQLIYIINHAEDKMIFVDASLVALMEPIAEKLKTVKHFILFNTPPGFVTKLPNVLIYEDLLAETGEEFEWKCTDESMAMGLCYTSGTTGHPKGVLYSHRSMFLHTYAINLANSLSLVSSDVVLPVVPQFHAQAWGLPYACTMVGAEVVMPGMHLAAAPLADMIEKLGVTVAAGVPTIWTGLYHELKANRRDLSKLRSLVVGGSAMPRSLIEAFEKELNVNVLHAWGMTEMSPVGTVSKLQDIHHALSDEEKWDVKATQGYQISGVEMRIMDEEGMEMPWDGNSVGELQVRGPWVVKRYFKQEPETLADNFTKDGWFRTGDVASVSADGYMKITDRTKDLIKSGGEWISSVELENALIAHPKVREAAVIAIPDEKWSERPLAIVVPVSPENPVEMHELASHLAARFSKLWLPEKYVFVKEIPKTSVGKIDKKVLRHRYKEGQLL